MAYRSADQETVDLDGMLSVASVTVPGNVLILGAGLVLSVHPAVIALVIFALAVQAAIAIYAKMRKSKLLKRRQQER